MKYRSVERLVFQAAFAVARETVPNIRKATSQEVPSGRSYYLADDMLSGFVVSWDGELTNLFSVVKGRGAGLVTEAKRQGASHLDCFDGYLTSLYSQHGFVVTRREENWSGPEYPDVVFMSLNV